MATPPNKVIGSAFIREAEIGSRTHRVWSTSNGGCSPSRGDSYGLVLFAVDRKKNSEEEYRIFTLKVLGTRAKAKTCPENTPLER